MDFNVSLSYDIEKGARLLGVAARLGWDLSGYGCVAVNQGSGNVYLWLEDRPCSLFISLGGRDTEVEACWYCGSCGEESMMDVTDTTTAYDLEQWARELEGEGFDSRCDHCRAEEEEVAAE